MGKYHWRLLEHYNSPVVQLNENTGTGTTLGLSGFTGLNSLAIDNAGIFYRLQ